MTEKERLLELGQELCTLGAEFRMAQIGLEKAVEEHGLSSPEAVEIASLCSDLTLHFSQAEEKFLALKALITSRESKPGLTSPS